MLTVRQKINPWKEATLTTQKILEVFVDLITNDGDSFLGHERFSGRVME